MSSSSSKQLLLLEHINYNIPSRSVAKTFYVDGLGCEFNPVGSNDRQLHVNCGAGQIHLPYLYSVRGREPVTIPHVLDGYVELLTKEPLAAIAERLEKLFPLESNTNHPVSTVERTTKDSLTFLQVSCPWGNIFHVHPVEPPIAERWLSMGEHPGGSKGIVGIQRIVVNCPIPVLPQIAEFYRDVLDCEALLLKEDRVVVPACALGQELVFQGAVCNDATATQPSPNDYDADEAKRFHIAMYLQDHSSLLSSFEKARPVLYINDRFLGGPLEFSSSTSTEETDVCGQYRTKDMRNKEGRLFFTLELEIRSPKHKCFPLRMFSVGGI